MSRCPATATALTAGASRRFELDLEVPAGVTRITLATELDAAGAADSLALKTVGLHAAASRSQP